MENKYLEKIAGLSLGNIGKSIKASGAGVSPLAKKIGIGAAGGAATGAVAGGEGNRTSSAITGGLLGAAGGAAMGRKKRPLMLNDKVHPMTNVSIIGKNGKVI